MTMTHSPRDPMHRACSWSIHWRRNATHRHFPSHSHRQKVLASKDRSWFHYLPWGLLTPKPRSAETVEFFEELSTHMQRIGGCWKGLLTSLWCCLCVIVCCRWFSSSERERLCFMMPELWTLMPLLKLLLVLKNIEEQKGTSHTSLKRSLVDLSYLLDGVQRWAYRRMWRQQ